MAMNGLEKITDKILAEAEAEAKRITRDAEAEAARIKAEYEGRAEELRARLTAEAERDCTDLVARAKNSATVEKRNAILRVRGELVDETFDMTLHALRTQSGEKYTALLAGLLTAAFLEQIEAEVTSRTLYGEEDAMAPARYEVLLCAADREAYGEELLSAVRTRLVGKVDRDKLDLLILSDETAAIDGGLILRCGDVESNCSLELLFAGLRRELEGEVSHALFDKKERN